MPYFKDDGTEFNPDLISKSSRCVTCKKNDDPKYEIPCNLTRADQDEDIFMCFDYEPNSPNIDDQGVLREMEDYRDQKCGKLGEKRNAG